MRQWLKEAREAKCLTQRELGKRAGISQPACQSIEAGATNPKPATAKKIAQVLNIDWTRFYQGEDATPPARQWLSEARSSKGYTKEHTAELSGVSLLHYSRIERGRKSPSPSVAKRIADVLGIDLALFYQDKEPPSPAMCLLTEARLRKGYSGRCTAKLAGLSQTHYQAIEAGKVSPSAKAAQRIAQVLGIDWTQFYQPDTPTKEA